jgi:hypothetical protein
LKVNVAYNTTQIKNNRNKKTLIYRIETFTAILEIHFFSRNLENKLEEEQRQ